MTDRLAAAVAELVAALREDVLSEPAVPGPDRLLSVDAASLTLGIGRTMLLGEISAGRLRSMKVGRRRLVPSAAIAEYIAASGVTPR